MERRQRNLVVGVLTATAVLLVLSFSLGKMNRGEKPISTDNTSISIDDTYTALDIKVNEQGLVTWNKIPNAKEYVLDIQWYEEEAEEYYGINTKTSETSYQLEEGQSIMIKIIYADGTESEYSSSVEYIK